MHRPVDDRISDEGLAALVEAQRPGFSLDQRFYTDPLIFERDLEHIFLREWLYVGHVSQIPKKGDFLTFEITQESVIVVRGGGDRINALVNVCRHRGSRICTERSGTVKKLVCPYHAWTYDLDGRLIAARLMPEDFDKSGIALKAIHACVLHGFILINFAEDPPSLEAVRRDLEAPLTPFRFERTKVAHSGLYPIESNWKLAIENYVECYHCAPAHPEFSKSHGLKLPRERITRLHDDMMARAEPLGLAAGFADRLGSAAGPSGIQSFYDRYPLISNYVTGSEDGKPLAPLLGDLEGYDGGASNIQIGASTFFLVYNDHAVVYRFTPRALQETDVEVVWLVKDTAVEGRDYDIDRLTWLWHLTTEADKRIIERNQQGVNSRYYRPGPYSPTMEPFALRFVEWYLETIAPRAVDRSASQRASA